MLEQARAHRAEAARAIRLAGDITVRDVVQSLLDYAQVLDRLAVEAEERAFALIEATVKTRTKSTARGAPIAEITAQLPPAAPPSTSGVAADGGE
ncbi:MAG TPA: hypothetical protein VMA53_22240 [Stellaceae bacterium]|nr:hypothetical protein [Stellaceae bacterium]